MNKNMFRYFSLFVSFARFGLSWGLSYDVNSYDLLMPKVTPYTNDNYLCTSLRVAPDNEYYIVGFRPNATMNIAHHMLLYGCTTPGTNDPVWDCGEMMSSDGTGAKYVRARPCQTGSQVVYAWARDAPKLKLPSDVGFHVGGDTPIKYLVLQVHYKHKFPEGKTDDSGVFLEYTLTPMLRQAGVILLGTGGMISPHTTDYFETACTINEPKTINPFAFRTHTHGLGKLVAGYVVRQNPKGDEWQLIGKMDPLKPQMFYPVVNYSPIRKGDTLAARCTMHNFRDNAVSIGSTDKDEMCNFYLMYWVENTTPLDQKYCFSPGPPMYYWSTNGFNRVPKKEII